MKIPTDTSFKDFKQDYDQVTCHCGMVNHRHLEVHGKLRPNENSGYVLTQKDVENWPKATGQLLPKMAPEEPDQFETQAVVLMGCNEIWKCGKCGSIGIVEHPATENARLDMKWYSLLKSNFTPVNFKVGSEEFKIERVILYEGR